jgi:hypothetical protein
MTPKSAQVDAGKSHLGEHLLALGHAFEYLAAMVSEGGSEPANVIPERGVTFELRHGGSSPACHRRSQQLATRGGVLTVSRSMVFDKTVVISNRAPFRRTARFTAHSSSKNWLHETKFDIFELDE